MLCTSFAGRRRCVGVTTSAWLASSLPLAARACGTAGTSLELGTTSFGWLGLDHESLATTDGYVHNRLQMKEAAELTITYGSEGRHGKRRHKPKRT